MNSLTLRVCTVLSAISLLGILSVAAAVRSSSVPNILLIYTDDMGYGQPSCYDGELARTPNLDSIARNGVRFTHGYVSACICSPSRVGLMTGRYQARTGHDGNTNQSPDRFLDSGEKTMAEYLKEAGYKTGMVGKWHLGHGPEFLPTARGFDSFYGCMSNVNEIEHFHRGTNPVPSPENATPVFRDEAVQFINASKDGPFFLYLAFTAIHAPHIASENYLNRFETLNDPREQAYAAMISEMDDAVGEVLTCLNRNGLEEETLVIHISDNGGAAAFSDNGPFQGGKWSLLEGGIRVPFMVQWKGHIRPGQVISEPVIQLDVLPTLLDVARWEGTPTRELDGTSLLPLLEGRKSRLSQRSFFWRFGPQFAVRRGDWKLVKAEEADPAMLFNLIDDPGEAKNRKLEYPGIAEELQKKWDVWNGSMRPARWKDARSGGLRSRALYLEQRRKKQK